ncbi:MAG: FprA family A-type flavoprotein [Candidatus Bathyarchaeota archaeon]|jgi:flavorubredoxin
MIELKEGIYWVGALDWDIRNFHGYVTHRGTTYNTYLVVDEKVALVDTVKDKFFPEMMKRIMETVDPSEIDYLISNHTEPDHSGCISKFMEIAENAELIASQFGVRNLREYYGEDLVITSIKEKPSVNLGRRTLQFVPVPMAHWPDSMVTYVPEEKILFSNDAFGQHLASSGRFDDEVDPAVLMQEATTYYANILMPLWTSVGRALKALEGVEVEIIAPSHGIIWRSDPGKILEAYLRWVEGGTVSKAVVVYDTMWGSTQKIAQALVEGLIEEGAEVKVHKLGASHNSDAIADILDARAILVGSPTLNNGLFPTVASFLAYLEGLKPRKKVGAFFGSYGWGGGARKAVETSLEAAGIELIESELDFKFRPKDSELNKAREIGRTVAKKILSD